MSEQPQEVAESREAMQIARLRALMDQTRTMTRLGLSDDALTLNFAQIEGALAEGGQEWDVSHGVTPEGESGALARHAEDWLAYQRGDLDAATLMSRTGFDPEIAAAIATAIKPVCPECTQGKHGNCDGTAWDEARDEVALCHCTEEGHP